MTDKLELKVGGIYRNQEGHFCRVLGEGTFENKEEGRLYPKGDYEGVATKFDDDGYQVFLFKTKNRFVMEPRYGKKPFEGEFVVYKERDDKESDDTYNRSVFHPKDDFFDYWVLTKED